MSNAPPIVAQADLIQAEILARVTNVELKINILLSDQVKLDMSGLSGLTDDFRDQKYGPRTYAQHGDDLVILNIFDMLDIAKPSYIDVGAHDPFKISNTALLYQRGCRGINVEANPVLIKAFRTQRPEDINLNVGASGKPGNMTFHMFDERSGLNTFSPDQVRRIETGSSFRVQRTIEVPVMTVPQILNEHWSGNFPDLLSLDVEGLDLEVLMSIEYEQSAPKLICVEANSTDLAGKIKSFLGEKNYRLVFCAAANLFFLQTRYMSCLQD
jgi:FkbM family methyltransferase